MNITYKIFLRTDHQNINGTNSVCLRVTQKRVSKTISLHIKVKPTDWNEKKHIVKKSDVDYLRKNKYLRKYENKATDIIDKYFLNDKPLSLNEFTRAFVDNDYNQLDFFEFVENEIKIRVLAKDTLRTYKGHLSKIKKFRSKINIQDINIDFGLDYKAYMINRLGNKESTYYKSIAIVRNFLNWAIEKNIIETNPLKDFKIKKIGGNREFLTIDETEKLEILLSSNKLSEHLKEVLQYFLFSCYTGLRYTDLKELKYKNIKSEIRKNKEYFKVSLIMHKTKLPVSIPIIEKSKKFLKTDFLQNELIFKVKANQTTNRHLKEIMKIASIDKNISFHCARHTFATIGIDLGIKIEIISKMLGHTDLKTTQIYAKIRDEVKFNELSKFDLE